MTCSQPPPPTGPARRAPRLLLLAPSVGFGGGIERAAAAVQHAWEGPCERVDLYRRHRIGRPAGAPLAKVGFASRTLAHAVGARPDVVLALHVGLLPVAATLACATRRPYALMAMGGEVWSGFGPQRRRLISRTSRLLAISDFTAQMLAEHSGVDREAIATVPLPVDQRIFMLAKRSSSRPRQAMLLTVSRISSDHRYKGHREVAASLPRVLESYPDVRWHVVGSGDDVQDLRQHCLRLGVEHAVTFEGSISDVRLAELYGRASVHVLPSVTDTAVRPPTGEGFGLVYAEAAAFGVPSIASSASGGAADVVLHGETGWTVPPHAPDDLAEAIVLLLGDQTLRDRLGAAAQRRVCERHTPQAFARSLRSALAADEDG